MLKKPFRLTELTAAVRDAIKQPPAKNAAAVVRLDSRRAPSPR